MCKYKRLDRIKNKVIKENVGVIPIEDKMREIKLRWFGHVKTSENTLVRRCKTIRLSGCRRDRGQPKKSETG